MMAGNALRGDMPLADWTKARTGAAFLMDVREPQEFAQGHLDGAVNVPLTQLRKRIGEVPRGREIYVYCAAGQRAYFAQRLLLQNGFDAKNLSGGYETFTALRDAKLV